MSVATLRRAPAWSRAGAVMAIGSVLKHSGKSSSSALLESQGLNGHRACVNGEETAIDLVCVMIFFFLDVKTW